MRITPSMMMSDYQKTLENNLDRLNDESEKVSSERKFTRGSQDPIDAIKTLRTNRELASTTQYQQSVKESGSWLTATETAVSTVDKVLQTANTTLLQAKNGSNNTSDAKNLAGSVSGYQKEILNQLDSTFNGQYIFGGSANGPQPFKIGTASEADLDAGGSFDIATQVDGKLLYNIPNTDKYIPVSAINNSSSGDPGYQYSINNPAMKYTMPVDLGLGLQTDASHNVVSGTAFETATSALDFLVVNPTGTSSENVIDALGTAATQMNAGNTSQLGNALTMVQTAQDAELKTTVTIGEKSKLMTYLNNKLTNDSTNLTTRLSDVADIDIAGESTQYLMDQMVYNASLSIGSTILQHSLIDFLK